MIHMQVACAQGELGIQCTLCPQTLWIVCIMTLSYITCANKSRTALNYWSRSGRQEGEEKSHKWTFFFSCSFWSRKGHIWMGRTVRLGKFDSSMILLPPTHFPHESAHVPHFCDWTVYQKSFQLQCMFIESTLFTSSLDNYWGGPWGKYPCPHGDFSLLRKKMNQ